MLRKTSHKYLAVLMTALCVLNSTPTVAFAKTSLEIANEHGANLNSNYMPEGSIVTEDHTGRILWAENINREWTPASMSKLMVILLAYDAIDRGELSLDTEIPVTDEMIKLCKNQTLSNNDMKAGCSYTISELIDLVIVPSSAAGTYMLADAVNPNRTEYVKLMNERAQSLQMTDTHYTNPVGVKNRYLGYLAPEGADPDADNYTSARDYAILAGELINKHPDILNHTADFNITVKEGTPYEEHFRGYVHSLRGARYYYEGTDGLKSGSADKGYNYTSTCKRGDTRLNMVILGVGWWDLDDAEWQRHLIGNALYDEAFDTYEYRQILKKGETYTVGDTTFTAKDDLWDCVRKDFTIENLIVDDKNGTARVDMDTDFLPGYEVPTAKISTNFTPFGAPTDIDASKGTQTFIISLVATLAIIFIIKASKKGKKKSSAEPESADNQSDQKPKRPKQPTEASRVIDIESTFVDMPAQTDANPSRSRGKHFKNSTNRTSTPNKSGLNIATRRSEVKRADGTTTSYRTLDVQNKYK